MHVYGTATDDLLRDCERHGLPAHVFAWSDAVQAAGFARDAAYLVRPDGYVARLRGLA
jgi:hypothetical protein